MSTLFLKKSKNFPGLRNGPETRGASVLVAEVFPVADHDVGEELSGGGGGVGNGVGSGLNGAEDVLLPGTAGGDDGDGRELGPDLGHYLRGPGRAGDH